MIWCRFQVGDRVSYGTVEGETITEVSGTPFDDHAVTSNTYPLGSVKLLVPVVPPTFYCAGINYLEHVIQMSRRMGMELSPPAKPDIGYRAVNALIAHEENIVMPRDAHEDFQYEGELVAVIGKVAKKVSREEALDCVLGYTIGNDVSERVWQREDRTFWRSKNSDTFKPMGPWIVTGLDPGNMRTTVRLNGRVVADFDTGNMIFDVATYISETSKHCTLYPGDVMWMGTDLVPENMKPGDTVEVEISGIGVLQNYVVREE